MLNVVRRLLGLHVHAYGPWALEERVQRLVGPLGRTEHPVYFNRRVCACGHVQLQRIKEG